MSGAVDAPGVPTYNRGSATELREVDRWDGGVGWVAHPGEGGGRVSHAVDAADGGVWVLDPLDAPGVDDLLADRGAVRGVVVGSEYHARDAGAVARRHDVAVHVHRSLDRAADRVDAPVERFAGRLGEFDPIRLHPLFAWRETALYRPDDGTLYVPDFLSSHPKFRAGGERIGMPSLSRVTAPPDRLVGLDPARVLFGHGEGVFEDAAGALSASLTGARRRFPRALSNAPAELRAILGALR
jgi:hypothetical protein